MTKPRFVGGYATQTKLNLFYREEGILKSVSTRARWSSYFDLNRLEPEHRIQFERSPYVVSAKPEGNWLRVDWKSKEIRRGVMLIEERGKPIDNWFRDSGVIPHEIDVHPIRRFFVDTNSEVEPNPRVAYLDIETDSRLSFAEKHKMRILCVCVVAGCDIPELDIRKGDSKDFVLDHDTHEDETRLLVELFEYLAAFDVVSAWYGDGFDFEVIRARAEGHKLNVNFERWRWLDQLEVFRMLNAHVAETGDEKQSMALENVAQALIGEGKHHLDASKTWSTWREGGESRRRLVDYCKQDTMLLHRIEEHTGYIALFGTICAACKLFMETRSLKSTSQMDGFMLALAKERGHHFPSTFGEPDASKYEGAYVMQPECKGIQHDVHVADFSSLYPSIIITWNMSPETLNRNARVNGPVDPGHCRAPMTGLNFKTDVEGMLPVALKQLIGMRKQWNDLKSSLPPGTPEWANADRWSTAYKVLANSFYGVLGSTRSRYYDRGIARSVTTTGAWLIKSTISEATKWGFETIYGDTDSIFVTRSGDGSEINSKGYVDFEKFVNHCNQDLYPKMLEKQGCSTNRIKLAYEKAFTRLALVSAKKYVGVYAHYKGKSASGDSKPEVKGLEYKRGDAVRLARHMQGECIDMFVGANENQGDYEELVERWRERVLKGGLELDDVVIVQSLTKPINEYVAKTPPAHVRVARLLKERGEDVSVGVKIGYFIVDGDVKSGGAKVAPASDWKGDCDRFALWESRVYPATQRLLESLFPSIDWGQYLKVRPRKSRVDSSIQPSLFDRPLPPAPKPKPVGPMVPSVLPFMLTNPLPPPSKEVVQALEEVQREPKSTAIRIAVDGRRSDDGDTYYDPKLHDAIKKVGEILKGHKEGATQVLMSLRLKDGEVDLVVDRKIQLKRGTLSQLKSALDGFGKINFETT